MNKEGNKMLGYIVDKCITEGKLKWVKEVKKSMAQNELTLNDVKLLSAEQIKKRINQRDADKWKEAASKKKTLF